MPLQCEQFISSLSKLLLTSPNIEKLVSTDDLHYLINIRVTVDREELLRTTLNDSIGAVSFIKPTYDEYNREGVYNHTIIFKLRDYFNMTQPTQLFTNHFFKDKIPKRLETLDVSNSEVPEQT